MKFASSIAVVLFLGSTAIPDEPTTLRVALASIRKPETLVQSVEKIQSVLKECAAKKVQIVCFPETFLPGLRGLDKLSAPDQAAMEKALKSVSESCRDAKVAAIVGVEWVAENGLQNRAYVISAEGKVLGYQTKNQITPGKESDNYVPDGKRQMFEIDGVKFGIVICHEGWRYPETVRWAAVRGAKVVFQPQVTGSDNPGEFKAPEWGTSFYEMAMQCRAQENSIFFASVNRTMNRQNSATSLIDPKGKLIKHVPRGEESLLISDLDLTQATGFYAKRFQPRLYEESTNSPPKK